MDRRLWMHNDFHLPRWYVEQATCLDDLETFIHQGGRVDGDPFPHLPGGVVQRLLYGNRKEFGFWCLQERSAGGGEPDPLNLIHAAPTEALVDGVMFAVDRKERFPGLARSRCDQFAGGNQTLLIGEADGLAGFDCFVGSLEAGHPDDSANHEIDVRMGGDLDRPG